MPRDNIFPPLDPYQTGYLAVDHPHRLYWEQCGNPSGVPLVFMHGGPGAGASPMHRRLFDPSFYRIVIFDQRGAGPFPTARRNQRQHHPPLWWPISKRYASIWASSGGMSSADRGEARWRWPMPKSHPDQLSLTDPARDLLDAPAGNRLVPLRHAHDLSRKPGSGSRPTSPRRSAATCLRPITAGSPIRHPTFTCLPHGPGRSMRGPVRHCCPIRKT